MLVFISFCNQPKGWLEEVLFFEIMLIIMIGLGVLGLINGESGSFWWIAGALFVAFLILTSNSDELKAKGFQSVSPVSVFTTLAVTRNSVAHIPGTPEGCQVKLKWDDNEWYVSEPKVSTPIETAQGLADHPEIVRWCEQNAQLR